MPLLLALALLSSPGCESRAQGDLVVLAAASLTDAFEEIARGFERAHPGARVLLSFAGSQTLATQLREGIAADVIATANPEIMEELASDGLVESPRVFGTNRLVWIFPRDGAPGDARAIAARLARPNWRVVLAAPEVPVGRYARQALGALDLLDAVEARLVSQELDVKGVIAKVGMAGADAGIVYATDVTPELRPHLAVLELPAQASPRTRYLAARALGSPSAELAAAFLSHLEGDAGRGVLVRLGFGPP